MPPAVRRGAAWANFGVQCVRHIVESYRRLISLSSCSTATRQGRRSSSVFVSRSHFALTSKLTDDSGTAKRTQPCHTTSINPNLPAFYYFFALLHSRVEATLLHRGLRWIFGETTISCLLIVHVFSFQIAHVSLPLRLAISTRCFDLAFLSATDLCTRQTKVKKSCAGSHFPAPQ